MLVSRLTSDVQSLDEFVREALVEVVGSGLQIVADGRRARDPLAHAGARLADRAAGADRRRAGRSTTAPADAYHAIRDRVAETLTTLQEGLSGVRVIQAFRRERQTIDAYEPRSQAQVGAWRRASFVNIRLFTMIPLAQTVALVAVLLTAPTCTATGRSRGHDRRLRALPGAAVRPDRALQRVARRVPPGTRRARRRSSACCEAPNAVAERPGAVELPADGELVLRGVTFGYEAGGRVVEGRLAAARGRRARRARRRRPAPASRRWRSC